VRRLKLIAILVLLYWNSGSRSLYGMSMRFIKLDETLWQKKCSPVRQHFPRQKKNFPKKSSWGALLLIQGVDEVSHRLRTKVENYAVYSALCLSASIVVLVQPHQAVLDLCLRKGDGLGNVTMDTTDYRVIFGEDSPVSCFIKQRMYVISLVRETVVGIIVMGG
jgi:hypothetical protein